ncbi:hypothetical protein BH23CHL5_BH23CHL5_13380 [soil metagenome]
MDCPNCQKSQPDDRLACYHCGLPMDPDGLIESASEDSFPASDPPGWATGRTDGIIDNVDVPDDSGDPHFNKS